MTKLVILHGFNAKLRADKYTDTRTDDPALAFVFLHKVQSF